MLDRLRAIIAQRCADWGGELLAFRGAPDYVHARVALPPNLDLSRFVNNVKTTSSRLIRRDFAGRLRRLYRRPVFWSRSYCIVSCGSVPLAAVHQYLAQQRAPRRAGARGARRAHRA